MNWRKRLFSGIFFLCFTLAGKDCTVLFVSDTHAAAGAWARMAGLIRQERRKAGEDNTLLVDAGDTLHGRYPGSFRNGEIPLRIVNFLRFDVWVPGNHDFECTPFRFREFRGAVLGGNWKLPDFTPLAWKMFHKAGHRIAVVGIGESGQEYRILPDTGVTFQAADAVLDRAVQEALAAGAETLILVQHDGLYSRRGSLQKLLRRHPEFDLVIGAHSHQEIPGRKVGRAWFVQAGSHGKVLGKAILRFRKPGEPPEIQTSLLPLEKHPAAPWPENIARLLLESRLQGHLPAGNIPELAAPSAGDFRGALGDALARAMLEETHARVAICTGSRGKVTCPAMPDQEQFFRLLPYENELCTVRLTPEELEETVRYFLEFRRKRSYFAVRFEGVGIHCDSRGRLLRMTHPAPDKDGRIAVAVTDYDLAGGGNGKSPLARMIRRGEKGFSRHGIRIRDAVLKQFRTSRTGVSGSR